MWARRRPFRIRGWQIALPAPHGSMNSPSRRSIDATAARILLVPASVQLGFPAFLRPSSSRTTGTAAIVGGLGCRVALLLLLGRAVETHALLHRARFRSSYSCRSRAVALGRARVCSTLVCAQCARAVVHLGRCGCAATTRCRDVHERGFATFFRLPPFGASAAPAPCRHCPVRHRRSVTFHSQCGRRSSPGARMGARASAALRVCPLDHAPRHWGSRVAAQGSPLGAGACAELCVVAADSGARTFLPPFCD